MNTNQKSRCRQPANTLPLLQVKIIHVLSNGRLVVEEPTGHLRLADIEDLEVKLRLYVITDIE
jgi:hypothetical protein